MTSGPEVVQVREGEDAVARNRELKGATNPAQADEGTIRKEFAESIEANSVHGSDSLENAKIEIDFFFKPKRSSANQTRWVDLRFQNPSTHWPSNLRLPEARAARTSG